MLICSKGICTRLFFLHEGRHLFISHLTGTDIKKDSRALENALPIPPRTVNIRIISFAALKAVINYLLIRCSKYNDLSEFDQADYGIQHFNKFIVTIDIC